MRATPVPHFTPGLVLLAVAGLVLGAPAGSTPVLADDGAAWLPGSWGQSDGEITRVLRLGRDGAFVLTVGAGGAEESLSGRWSYDGGRLALEGGGDRQVYACERAAGEDAFLLSGSGLEEALYFQRLAPDDTPAGGPPAPPPPAPPAPAPPPPAGSAPKPAGAPPAGPRPAVGAGDPRLVGRWTCTQDFQKITITFLPDGRYFSTLEVAGVPLDESGAYAVEGGTLVFRTPTGQTATYAIRSLEGARLVVTTDALPAPLDFAREPGSETKVLEEARAADAAKARDDAAWRARLPIAVLETQPPHVAVGEVPADPQVKRIFERPTVFKGPNLYLRLSFETYVHRPGTGKPTGTFRTSAKWYFQSTGRVFVKFDTYMGSEVEGKRPGEPVDPVGDATRPRIISSEVHKQSWGRYRIEPGEAEDRVVLEMDDGEKIEMRLTDGRRRLFWGESVYDQVEWAKESLEGR